MPIKRLRVSFDLDMPTLLQMLAAGHSSMKIDVYGDDKPPRSLKQLANGHAQKALPAPNGRGGRGRRVGKHSTRATILAHLAANPEEGVHNKDLAQLMVDIGRSKNSASPQLFALKRDGHVKQRADGKYYITAAGKAQHEQFVAPAGA